MPGLAEAIGRGATHTSLLDRLTRQEARCRPSLVFDRRALERALRAKPQDWRALLARNLTSGREVMRALLAGPIRFAPLVDEGRRSHVFEGTIALDRLINGLVATPYPWRPQLDAHYWTPRPPR